MTKGIYQIRCKINARCYIGRANDINKRWSQHKNKLNNGKHVNQKLQKDWSKYSETNFEFTIIHRWKVGEVLEESEDMWIAQLEPYYNIAKGKRCKK